MLSDTERRQTYDAYGHEGLKGGGYSPNFQDFGSISDLFSAFFGPGGFDAAFGGTRMRGGAVQGGDVALAVQITLQQAAQGAEVEVVYDATALCETCHGNGAEPGTPIVTCDKCRGAGQIQAVQRTRFGQMVRTALCDKCGGDGRIAEQPCHTCDGRGMVARERRVKVDIPAGIADGQRMRVTGRGHAGERGGPPGDLYVVVRVKEDERFLRDREDLITVVDVAAPFAALGTTIQVPTLDGEVPLEVPAGTQPGETIVMNGPRHAAGRPRPHGRPEGRRQRRHPAAADPQAEGAARAVLGLADRGEPARERRHDREAQTGAGRVIRLGIRVRAADAEVAFARLEPSWRRAPRSRRGETVELAVYGESELPRRGRCALLPASSSRRRAGRSPTAGRRPGTSTCGR